MYIDLLIKLKNAQAAKKDAIKIHYSKEDERILEILKKNNYIKDFERKGKGTKRVLEAELNYKNGEGAINGIKFFSKPSRRIYIGYKEIKPVRRGYGLFVISTPKGILTGKEAKKIKVGGEALFSIW